MSYAQAITYIEDLPPIVQVPSRYGQQQPTTNPYYEEVVREHPNIQSKIRQTDTNYFGKYEETLPQPVAPPPRRPPPNEGRAVPIPEYPLKGNPPAFVQQNYLGGGMVANDQEQHLPIAQKVPIHYNLPLAGAPYQSTYPIVEHLTCDQCKNWQMKCERLYMLIIGALIFVVLMLLRKVKI